MRALILVAGAALAVSACSSNEAANNTMTEDANLMATDNAMMANDMMMTNDVNMMGTDANMMMNDTNVANAVANDMTTNEPDANLANGM